MTAETSQGMETDNDGVRDRNAARLNNSGLEITSHFPRDGYPGDELKENDKSEPPPLHKKLLAIAESGQPASAANLTEFDALLFEKKTEINVQDATGKTALHIAVEHGLKLEAKSLIRAGADVAQSDCEGQKPLYLACLEGQFELAKLLLAKNAIIDAASNNNETPLAAACRNGHLNIVNLLLDRKADTNVSDNESWTPLHWACWEGHEKIVERLLQADASNINAIETNENWTPLNIAIFRGNKRVVSLLLGAHADIFIRDYANWTPLMTATRMQEADIVTMLLGQSPLFKYNYLEIPDEKGRTPLHVASMEGYYEIASELIGAGAVCDARWSTDRTDVDIAAELGIEPGWTPLHFASLNNHFKIVELLLSKVKVDVKADNGRTALHVACQRGNGSIVKILLSKGASVNAQDNSGLTPLHLASGAREEDESMSDPDPVLSSSGVDYSTDIVGQSQERQSRRHTVVVELLLRNGADPGMRTRDGDTALHRAAALGDRARIDTLLSSIKPGDLSSANWKDSVIYRALRGYDPQAAMGSLLAKQEVKQADFWGGGGRLQVIREAARYPTLHDIMSLIFHEVPADGKNPPKGSENWGAIQWAAYERLPDVLSSLIANSESVGKVDEMVHDALQLISNSINPKELEPESCERLLQVMWNLVTSSERNSENTESVKKAYESVLNCSSEPDDPKAFSSTIGAVRRVDELILSRRRSYQYQKNSRNAPLLQEKTVAQAKTSGKPKGDQELKDRDELLRGLKSPLEKETEKLNFLGILRDILKDPPFAQMSQTHTDEKDYKPPEPGPNYKRIVKDTEATVVAFFKREDESGRIRRNRPIQEIVYNPGPTGVVGSAIRNLIVMATKGSLLFSSKLYAKKNLELTWVHLPSTNMVWMNDLFTRIMSDEGYRTREYHPGPPNG